MHAGTLAIAAQNALAVLGKSGVFSQAYLAGGSSLALQLGHRRSYDLDFYTREKLLAENLASQLAKIGTFKTTLLKPPHTLMGEFNHVKVSIFRYDYPLLQPLFNFKGINLAPISDIAAMKLTAIGGRATKRDYVDVYTITQKRSLEKQFEWYEKKFGKLGNNLYVIIKALGYFEDAEDDKMPKMFVDLTWEQVKNFLVGESLRLGRKYLT